MLVLIVLCRKPANSKRQERWLSRFHCNRCSDFPCDLSRIFLKPIAFSTKAFPPENPGMPLALIALFMLQKQRSFVLAAEERAFCAKMPHGVPWTDVAATFKLWFEARQYCRDSAFWFDPDQAHVGDTIVKNKAYAVLATMACLLFASNAWADKPVPWQTNFQTAATGIMEEITWFEHYTLWFIIPITLFVLLLLVLVVIKFRESANPVPSKTSHHTGIEIAWTLGPVIILLFLAIPSFQLLTAQLTPPQNPDLTVKATGNQWYWSYEYEVGESPLSFDSLLLKDEDRAAIGKADVAAYPRLLAVDNEVVVPVGKTVRLLVTAADVIHAFAMPAFGVKIDAVPGRLNETWFKADREGLYYGQCSELCGKDHAYMPIAIRVVSEDKYATWLAAAATNIGDANKALMAATDGAAKTVDVAANAAQ